MASIEGDYDYHGALVIVEKPCEDSVLIHPPGATADAPSSLPSDPCRPGEDPASGAVRIVKEKTGLDVDIVREFITFRPGGTPTGTMLAHGLIATVKGGEMLANGPEGLARAYSMADLPGIVPIRVANRRTLDEYLRQREATSAN